MFDRKKSQTRIKKNQGEMAGVGLIVSQNEMSPSEPGPRFYRLASV